MEALSVSSFPFAVPSPLLPSRSDRLGKPIFDFPISQQSNNRFPSSISHTLNKKCNKFKLFAAMAQESMSIDPLQEEEEATIDDDRSEKFDWFSEWYPVMPVCDLDKRAPHGKKVMGLDVVVWWDRNDSAWKVFADRCPHRLAPLSEGRIDQWGRLQCVYHGWCFGGSGDCKFIPQAPRDAPPIHTSERACVAVYPSTVQNDIVWFWPNTDPQYKDIITRKQPPYIPELNDPSFTKPMGNRDIPYGYEILIENLMDPTHVPYAHYGVIPFPQPNDNLKGDREGGRPFNITVQKLDRNGFTAKNDFGGGYVFVPPCVFSASVTVGGNSNKVGQVRKTVLVFVCVPVSPGKSRLIYAFPKNWASWWERFQPRWMFHMLQNLVLDSDLVLLHLEERKIMEIGPSNWQKACYVPTKSDGLVVAYRRWLRKYAYGQIDWGNETLPPIPPREQLLDRYWSHVVNCTSCSVAYKGLSALEVALQVFSVASIAIVAASKQGTMSAFTRNSLVIVAVAFFTASRWLSHFIYKNFHFHDYDHSYV